MESPRLRLHRKEDKSVGIADLDGSPSDDESDLTRNVGEVTAFIRGLQAKELTAVDRADLRFLLDELEAFARTATSQISRRVGEQSPRTRDGGASATTGRRARSWPAKRISELTRLRYIEGHAVGPRLLSG
jgi:hypothetical protein